VFTHFGSCRIFELFLPWYHKLKASGNYTAVAMHNQSKSVGKKSATKRKGSAVKRPEIETYTNRFQHTEISHYEYDTPKLQSQLPFKTLLKMFYLVILLRIYHFVVLRMHPSVVHHIIMSCESQLPVCPKILHCHQLFTPLVIKYPHPLHIRLIHFISLSTQTLYNHNNQPFEVKFLTGHIKICAGCCNGYACGTHGSEFTNTGDSTD